MKPMRLEERRDGMLAAEKRLLGEEKDSERLRVLKALACVLCFSLSLRERAGGLRVFA